MAFPIPPTVRSRSSDRLAPPARSANAFTNPKSVTFNVPSSVIRQFAGLMSRCALIPLLNACVMPSQNSIASRKISLTSCKRGVPIHDPRSPPLM